MIVLESLSLTQTRGRRPPRVAIVVQTGGSIHGVKITGVAIVVQTGGKATCRNSRTARNGSDQLGLDPVVIHVSQPLLESLSWCQPLLVSLSWCQPLLESLSWCQLLLESLSWFKPGFGTLLELLSWCQPRGVTTRVVIRGGRRTVRVVLAVYAVGFNPVV
jgi:hypothetical protein